jgi:hypothetical protein
VVTPKKRTIDVPQYPDNLKSYRHRIPSAVLERICALGSPKDPTFGEHQNDVARCRWRTTMSEAEQPDLYEPDG